MTNEETLQRLVEQQEKLIDHLLEQIELYAHPAWGVRLRDTPLPLGERTTTTETIPTS